MNTQYRTDSKAAVIVATMAMSDPEFDAFAQEHAVLAGCVLPVREAGDLAQDVLTLLRESPEAAYRIEVLSRSSAPERFDGGTLSVPALVAVLFLLRTHVNFKRHADGRWEFEIGHKPADSAALSRLVKKLLTLLPGAIK